jgi:alkyl hydroperoxide reductase subunit AhpC
MCGNTRLVGALAPSFTTKAVIDGHFKDVSLSDYKGKWKVVFFYPLDFTFVCPTEIIAFDAKISAFKERNCEILGISTDSHYSHLAWCKQDRSDGGIGHITYPLLSDFNKTISRAYNVLVEEEGVALRGLFIIDDQDIIQHATINNLSVGRNIDESLRILDAFQFHAKHHDVCPANWKLGEDAIKADVNASKAWFKKHAH